MGKSNSFGVCVITASLETGGRVAPIDLESVALGIRLSDRHYTLANLAEDVQSLDIPG